MTLGVLESGMATGIGSLPYLDPAAAAATELALQPNLPAAPQLPRRDPREGMLAQVALGMPGVSLRSDGTLDVDRRIGAPDECAPLDAEAWAGALAFLGACSDRTDPIKLQLTGPVTLGLALTDAGARPAKAFSAAAAAVRIRAKALLDAARRTCPAAPVVLVLDEPSLDRAGRHDSPLGPEETIDLVSSALATATSAGAAVNGVHCCGPVDWTLVLHAGPDLVSVPATSDVLDGAAALAMFLDRGGWIAWGVVPTDRPFGGRYEAHWQRLNQVWTGLAAAGCDPVALRTQALLTPACGLAAHDEAQVEVIMALVARVAERVQDQAYAARLSVGA